MFLDCVTIYIFWSSMFIPTSTSSRVPTPVAVLISAAIFALAHLTPGEFPQLFVLGNVNQLQVLLKLWFYHTLPVTWNITISRVPLEWHFTLRWSRLYFECIILIYFLVSKIHAGTALGFSYAQTHNLLTPITIHALWNSGVILLLTFLSVKHQSHSEIEILCFKFRLQNVLS